MSSQQRLTLNNLIENLKGMPFVRFLEPRPQIRLFLRRVRVSLPNLMRDVFWSLLVAALAAGATFFVLTRTDYMYWVNNALANGRGPYEISLFITALALLFYNFARVRSLVRRVPLNAQITIVDKTVLGFIFWGIMLWHLSWPKSLDWGRLSEVVIVSRSIWGLGLLWLVGRVSLAVCRAFTGAEPAAKPRLLSDHPIGVDVEDEDMLGRSNVVGQIASVIKDFDYEGSFVIAVTGEWGSGKTTVLNLALRQLREEPSVIPVIFDPWYFSVGTGQNLDRILERFFAAIEDAISDRVFRPDLKRIATRYCKAISPVLEKSPISLDSLLGEGQASLEETKRELRNALKSLEAKVALFVDDLDRMDGLEIAYVFKLIRLCADFDNLVYVLAFDRNFVQDQLKKDVLSEKPSDYVDKIVQLELALPKVEPVVLDAIFSRYLSYVEQQLDIALGQDPGFLQRMRSVFHPHILQLLPNIRLIKLFVNRYLMVIPAVRGEVNYFDLLVLEIIRLRHPKIYEVIYRNPGRFTFLNQINWRFPGGQNQEAQQVASFYEEMVADLSARDREAVFSLLGSVFNSVRCYHRRDNTFWTYEHEARYREQQSAAHPYYFPRYFYLAVQQGVVPDVIWDNVLAEINAAGEYQQMEQIIDSTIEVLSDAAMVTEWLNKMRLSVPRIAETQIPFLVRAITGKTKMFSDERASFFSISDFRIFNFLVVDLLGRLEPGQVEEVTVSVIETCPDVGYIRYLLYWFDPEEATEQPEARFREVDFQRLRSIASTRIRHAYIEGGRNILEEPHHHDSGLYTLEYLLSEEEYRPYIQHLLETDPRNVLRFLTALISRGYWATGGVAGTYRVLDYRSVKSYVDPSQLLEIAETIEPPSDLSADEEWALSALREGIDREAQGEVVESVKEMNPSLL